MRDNANIDNASAEEVDRLCNLLQDFNRPWLGAGEEVQINLAARSENGDLLGGILASVSLGWLEIHVLWVDARSRVLGTGTSLLTQCEQIAISMKAHSSRLDTFDWQAENFYERRGYVCFARLENYPTGHQRIFMKKHF